jgi:hypothetical protein
MEEAEHIVIGSDTTSINIELDWRSIPRAQPPVLFGEAPSLPATFKKKHKTKSCGHQHQGFHKSRYNYKNNNTDKKSWGGRSQSFTYNDLTSSSITAIDNHIVATTDGGKMKYCPGNSCRVLLPLFQFGANCNMRDGMDTYCIECNKRKRREREEKRQMVKMGMYSIDAYEEYRLKQNNNLVYHNPVRRSGSRGTFASILYSSDKSCVLKRDIIRIIDNVLIEARMMHRFEIPFSAHSVYDKLFAGRRLVCDVTGRTMTPVCFEDHHEVRVVKIDDRLEVKCSHCSSPSSQMSDGRT